MAMRPAPSRTSGLLTIALLGMALPAAPAMARTASRASGALTLPAGSLPEGLRRIAADRGTEIISLEPGLSAIALPAQRLTGDGQAMLDRLLRGTGFRAVRIAADSFRVERHGSPGRVRRQPPAPPPAADIIVTASKFPVPLARYPGSVVQMIGANDAPPSTRGGSMDTVAARLPVLQRTELGEGRNKTFIRGIADSSFNGSTQSTASIYFGDALLGFGSPSPSLKLYDIANVEVLEGPQGTLYGSGSLGGVIHISPNAVDLDRVAASTALGASATVGGQPGWDLSGMVNVPLVASRVGLRVVGYHEHQGGYIDNPAAGRDNNSVNVSGGRLMMAADVAGLRLNLGLVYQATDGHDAPYARAQDGALQRRARIEEPYASDLLLGYLVLEKSWAGGLQLTSVTSLGNRSSFDSFDSTPRPTAPPLAYQIDRSSRLFAQEARLARRSDHGLSWVVGATYQSIRDGLTRSLGVPDAPAELDEVTNTTYAASAFGQATVALASRFDMTLGLRWTAARTDSEPSRNRSPLIRGVEARRTDPTVALAWRVAPRTLLYGRAQTGYRNGGMAVARGVGRVANFDSDSVVMGEVGVRRLRSGARGLSASAAVSYTDWSDIQADLLTRRGLPYTANIGNAHILAVEATADWVPLSGLTLGGMLLYTDSRLSGPLTAVSALPDRRLPDTPLWSGTIHADYGWGDSDRVRHRVGGLVRYVGRSTLGPGMLIDVEQGDYMVADIQGGVRFQRLDLSLSVENVLNTRANRFAFGNPISFANRDQAVPLRPLTLRAAIGFGW
ncbi:TonB-dependent receptor [Sphingobium sufflavum]|uniref:TonB-dependent receptor n=1 Tax=Sphingobium sufflavum TaxID=1129547 RepID=UPI001F328F04|nr:TonB-dependent receptor [Sphingobium sufflavum]MCE7796368.1 TonB-dependent receptor [Sphingobium sufflavum]